MDGGSGAAVGTGEDLEEMPARVLEVNAPAAEVMIDLARLLLPRIGPVLEAPLLDASEDGVELGLAHEEGVMLHLDVHAIAAQEIERNLVADFHDVERAEALGRRQAE